MPVTTQNQPNYLREPSQPQFPAAPKNSLDPPLGSPLGQLVG